MNILLVLMDIKKLVLFKKVSLLFALENPNPQSQYPLLPDPLLPDLSNLPDLLDPLLPLPLPLPLKMMMI